MVIVVNTRLLLKDRLEGIGWFTYETLSRITRDHPEHTFVFLFDRPFSREFIFSDNIIPVVAWPPARHPILWYLWFEFRVPAILKKYKADLFLSPDGYLSLNTDVPQVAVIHDINFFHRPADLPWLKSRYYNRFFPRFARKARRIATVSRYSKEDICSSYNIPREKTDVVYNGVSPGFVPLSDVAIREARQKYTLGQAYFIFVGALHPRKNIEGLLAAYEIYRQETGRSEKLIVAGGQMFKTGPISLAWSRMRFKEDVLFTGRVEASELRRLVGAALAMVFVPFFEGFGIPVLEAMASGVPVICSDTTSLPEVGGDAAHYADPHDPHMIAGAMERISSDKEYRKLLVARGRKQLGRFSWDKTAGRLWDTVQSALDKEWEQSPEI